MPEPHGSGMLLSATGLIRLLAMFGASDSVSDQDIARPKAPKAVGQALRLAHSLIVVKVGERTLTSGRADGGSCTRCLGQ